MLADKRILVPIDGSAGSNQAIRTAISLASSSGAAIDFLYVADISVAVGEYPMSAKFLLPNSVLACVAAHGKEVISYALEQTPENVTAKGHCVSGNPAEVILEMSKQHNSGLIIMGSRGLGAIKSVLLGSVSRFLLTNAKCPMMIVKADEIEDKQEVNKMMEIKRILVPVDGSETSDRAIDQAIMMAKVCSAKLDFLYVANINQLAINACLSDAILEAVTKAGNVILDRALEKVPADVQAEGFSETGSPAVVILEFSNLENSDLIIMGSRGLGVVKGVLLGSVSQHLVEQAKCPVMVIK